MTHSTKDRGSRVTRALGVCGIAVLLSAAGCSSNSSTGDPTISAKGSRTSAGVLQKLTVDGHRFTPNGPVRITMLMAGGSTNASPVVEEDIQADSNGRIKYQKPVVCPQPADYGRGSWTTVVARDMTSGISGSAQLSPGGQPDCGS